MKAGAFKDFWRGNGWFVSFPMTRGWLLFAFRPTCRFVLRTNEQGRLDSKWVHPAEVRPGDLDCTDMDDDTFERTYRSWAEKAGEQA